MSWYLKFDFACSPRAHRSKWTQWIERHRNIYLNGSYKCIHDTRIHEACVLRKFSHFISSIFCKWTVCLCIYTKHIWTVNTDAPSSKAQFVACQCWNGTYCVGVCIGRDRFLLHATSNSWRSGSKSIAIVFPIVENAMTYCDVIIPAKRVSSKKLKGALSNTHLYIA